MLGSHRLYFQAERHFSFKVICGRQLAARSLRYFPEARRSAQAARWLQTDDSKEFAKSWNRNPLESEDEEPEEH